MSLKGVRRNIDVSSEYTYLVSNKVVRVYKPFNPSNIIKYQCLYKT